MFCYAGDTIDVGLIPGSGRSPGERNGNPCKYSCLENSMNRGTWWATIQEVSKSWILFFFFFFFSHCGFQSFSPGKLCLWQNREADRKHRVRSNFLRFCLQKVNKKLILQLNCFWSALELHCFPAITHLRLLFPSLCL